MTIDADMTLLDRFAAAVLPEVFAKFPLSGLPITFEEAQAIAATCYRMASAMLWQRNAVAENVRAQAMRPAAPTT